MPIHSLFLLLTVAMVFHCQQAMAQTTGTSNNIAQANILPYPYYPMYYGSMTFVREMPPADQRELMTILAMYNVSKGEVLNRIATWASDKGVTAKYDNYTMYWQRAFDVVKQAATTNFTGMSLIIFNKLCDIRQDINLTSLEECKKKREITADLFKDPFLRVIQFSIIPPPLIDGVPTPAGCYPPPVIMPRYTGTPQPSPPTTTRPANTGSGGGPTMKSGTSDTGGAASPPATAFGRASGGAPISMPMMPSINAISMPSMPTFGSGGNVPDISAAFKNMDQQGEGPKRMMDEGNPNPGMGPEGPEGMSSGDPGTVQKTADDQSPVAQPVQLGMIF